MKIWRNRIGTVMVGLMKYFYRLLEILTRHVIDGDRFTVQLWNRLLHRVKLSLMRPVVLKTKEWQNVYGEKLKPS